MSGATDFGIALLTHLSSVIICIICLIHWIYIHVHNRDSAFFRHLRLQMIILQYLTLISYTIVPLVYAMQLLQHLINHSIEIIADDNFDLHNLYNVTDGPGDIHASVAGSCYQIGKILNYTILLLRLKQMLKDSIFEYSKKVYVIMSCLIVSLLLLLICHYIISVFPVSKKRLTLWRISIMLWMLLDLTYFISVSYMFLSKLGEITNTYHRFIITVTKQSEIASASASIESNCKYNISQASDKDCCATIESYNNTNNDNNDSNDNKNVNVNNDTIDVRSVTVSSNQTRQVADKERIYQLLSQTMKVHTRLTIIIVVSSACVFGTAIVIGLILKAQFQGFIIMCVSVDATINSLCLLLFFDNARSFYCKLMSKCVNVFVCCRDRHV